MLPWYTIRDSLCSHGITSPMPNECPPNIFGTQYGMLWPMIMHNRNLCYVHLHQLYIIKVNFKQNFRDDQKIEQSLFRGDTKQ